MTRVVQLQKGSTRRVALVDEPHLRLVEIFSSVYELALAAQQTRESLHALAQRVAVGETLDYEEIYLGKSPWRITLPVDHPVDPARCLVSGTGLTHLGSAENRQAMHAAPVNANETDSMKMFRWGVEGGRPAQGKIGIAPEWFYKGPGTILRAHKEPLDRPSYADDGGEEAEIAGIYLIDDVGRPRRLGMVIGNEFSDHKFERRNYLNLAGSKLRTCSIGPELVLDPDFTSVPGSVKIERKEKPVWTKSIVTGQKEMSHSLANIEHHHFKFEAHRRPGDLHVHFYGAPSLSFGDGVALEDGDEMIVHFPGFGRALRNPLRVSPGPDRLIDVLPIG